MEKTIGLLGVRIMKNELIKYYWMVFISVLITAFFNPILYLFLLQTHSLSTIGIYLSFFWFISFLTEIPCGAITDRIGEKYAVIFSGLFRILGLIFLMNGNVGLLYLSGLCSGISESFYSGSLSSWIINRANSSKKEIDVDKLFSRSSFIGLFTSLVVGSLTIYYLYPLSSSLPFYLSIFSCIVLVFFAFGLDEEYNAETKDLKTIYKKTYHETISVFQQLFSLKAGFFIMCFLLLPEILDVGPSNQWQAVFSQIENSEKVMSILWIIITISGLIGSIVSSKIFKKVGAINVFSLLIGIDSFLVLAVCFAPSLWIKVVSFGLHVMMNTITDIKATVILHSNIVKSDDLRNTTVSTYYSFQSICISLMLVINGFSSDKLGIIETWTITIGIVFIMLITLQYMLKKLRLDKHVEY